MPKPPFSRHFDTQNHSRESTKLEEKNLTVNHSN